MSLSNDDFWAAYKAITGHDFPDQTFKSVVRPEPSVLALLLQAHAAVGLIAEATPDIFALPEVGRALEQKLIHLMIRCLAESDRSPASTGSQRQDLIVARLERFLEANPDRPIYLTEICTAIDVSERTLRAACEEHLGMGPIRYLTLRRMHLARRALLRASATCRPTEGQHQRRDQDTDRGDGRLDLD